jgi:ribosomal protein S27AE
MKCPNCDEQTLIQLRVHPKEKWLCTGCGYVETR